MLDCTKKISIARKIRKKWGSGQEESKIQNAHPIFFSVRVARKMINMESRKRVVVGGIDFVKAT